MKILFVTDLYPIADENTAKALFYIVQEWKRQGHCVEVVRSNFIFNSVLRGRKLIKEKVYIDNDIKIYNLNYFTPFFFDVYKKLPKDFSLNNYDVLISHMPCGALLAQKLLKRTKIKYICAVHASDIEVLTKFQYSFYFKKCLIKSYLTADKIAARSPVLQTKIEKLLPQLQDKTFVAYSGINDMIIKNKQESKFFGDKKFIITTAASLIKRKNIDIIIKAAANLNLRNFRLIIMGDGKERKRLEKLANKLNISELVTFTGRIDRAKVFDYLSKSDIFVLLSDNETFGLCYLEAMITDNVVIAKKDDGIDGILQNNQNAFLINANADELSRCICKILSMKDTDLEQIRQNAAETIKNLTLSSAAENYLRNISE